MKSPKQCNQAWLLPSKGLQVLLPATNPTISTPKGTRGRGPQKIPHVCLSDGSRCGLVTLNPSRMSILDTIPRSWKRTSLAAISSDSTSTVFCRMHSTVNSVSELMTGSKFSRTSGLGVLQMTARPQALKSWLWVLFTRPQEQHRSKEMAVV